MMESFEPKTIKKLANLDRKCLRPKTDEESSKCIPLLLLLLWILLSTDFFLDKFK